MTISRSNITDLTAQLGVNQFAQFVSWYFHPNLLASSRKSGARFAVRLKVLGACAYSFHDCETEVRGPANRQRLSVPFVCLCLPKAPRVLVALDPNMQNPGMHQILRT